MNRLICKNLNIPVNKVGHYDLSLLKFDSKLFSDISKYYCYEYYSLEFSKSVSISNLWSTSIMFIWNLNSVSISSLPSKLGMLV